MVPRVARRVIGRVGPEKTWRGDILGVLVLFRGDRFFRPKATRVAERPAEGYRSEHVFEDSANLWPEITGLGHKLGSME